LTKSFIGSKAIIAIRNPERHVHKASHCGSKQQKRWCSQYLFAYASRYVELFTRQYRQSFHVAISVTIACSRYIIMVLFFTHIPFVVNHTINATPLERLQHYNSSYNIGPFDWTFSISGSKIMDQEPTFL